MNGGNHLKLAEALQRAEEELLIAARMVDRAPFTDVTLKILQKIQCKLIDPLREEWETKDWDGENPYQSTNYVA